MAQKLAPAEKNSTDISAASATFCISEFSHILHRSEYLVWHWHRGGESQNPTLFRPMGAQIIIHHFSSNEMRAGVRDVQSKV